MAIVPLPQHAELASRKVSIIFYWEMDGSRHRGRVSLLQQCPRRGSLRPDEALSADEKLQTITYSWKKGVSVSCGCKKHKKGTYMTGLPLTLVKDPLLH
jgi:hypothetical protein